MAGAHRLCSTPKRAMSNMDKRVRSIAIRPFSWIGDDLHVVVDGLLSSEQPMSTHIVDERSVSLAQNVDVGVGDVVGAIRLEARRRLKDRRTRVAGCSACDERVWPKAPSAGDVIQITLRRIDWLPSQRDGRSKSAKSFHELLSTTEQLQSAVDSRP